MFHLPLNAQQILYVMADLVSKDVRLGRIAEFSKPALELLVETQVNVNAFARRAVERTSHRTARRHSSISKQNRLGISIGVRAASPKFVADRREPE